MIVVKHATQKALEQFQQALPHIEAARATLAEALGVDPNDRPELDLPGALDDSIEHWRAVRLLQNVWDAHLHVTDPFGS